MKKYQVIWPVLVLCGLYSAMIALEWRAIERDIAERTRERLVASGLSWVTVVTHNRGRDVLLIGEAPTEVDLRLAQMFAADVEGVRIVDSQMTLQRQQRFIYNDRRNDLENNLTSL